MVCWARFMEGMLVAPQDADCGVGSNVNRISLIFPSLFLEWIWWPYGGDELIRRVSTTFSWFNRTIYQFLFRLNSHITFTRKPLREVNPPKTPPATNHHGRHGNRTTPPGPILWGSNCMLRCCWKTCWRDVPLRTVWVWVGNSSWPLSLSHKSSQVLVKNVLASLPRCFSSTVIWFFWKETLTTWGIRYPPGFQTNHPWFLAKSQQSSGGAFAKPTGLSSDRSWPVVANIFGVFKTLPPTKR